MGFIDIIFYHFLSLITSHFKLKPHIKYIQLITIIYCIDVSYISYTCRLLLNNFIIINYVFYIFIVNCLDDNLTTTEDTMDPHWRFTTTRESGE